MYICRKTQTLALVIQFAMRVEALLFTPTLIAQDCVCS